MSNVIPLQSWERSSSRNRESDTSIEVEHRHASGADKYGLAECKIA